jgi:hypothetical protein
VTCHVLGQRDETGGFVVPEFAGTLDAALSLQELLRYRCRPQPDAGHA